MILVLSKSMELAFTR